MKSHDFVLLDSRDVFVFVDVNRCSSNIDEKIEFLYYQNEVDGIEFNLSSIHCHTVTFQLKNGNEL
jgi:hypothetical protein